MVFPEEERDLGFTNVSPSGLFSEGYMGRPESMSILFTWKALSFGKNDLIIAATPAAFGAAIEVPL